MKQYKIIKAYKAINKLYEQKLPLSVSHKLWMLRKALAPTWDFQVEKEQEVVMSFNPDTAPNGDAVFKTPEDAEACRKEFEKVCSELADLDVELENFKKITIHLDDKIEISVEDIEALEDFVDFVE